MIPVISGTVAGQTVAAGADIDPFTSTSITDGNDYISDTKLTISVLGANGAPTDADGTLSISPSALGTDTFTKTGTGTYVLTDTSAPSPTRNLPHFQPQLGAMSFIPSGAGTTTFNLTVNDSDGEHQTNSTTTVTASGAGSAAATTPTPTPVAAATTPTPTPTATPAASTDTSSSTAPNITATGWVGRSTVESLTQGDGQLTIDHPHEFRGKVDFTSGDIDLKGLANADSYTFKNDMLSILGSDGKVLDRVHLTSDSTSAFSVEKIGIAGVSIYTANDTQHPAGGTVLPMHTT